MPMDTTAVRVSHWVLATAEGLSRWRRYVAGRARQCQDKRCALPRHTLDGNLALVRPDNFLHNVEP